MKKKLSAVVAAVVAVAAIGIFALPSTAQVAPIAAEPLTPRSVFIDDIDLKLKIKLDEPATHVVNQGDPSRTAVVRFTVQPGVQFPWHTHPGPVIVNIVSGELVYVPGETCAELPYTAGQAFVDRGHGHVHSAVNPGTEPTVFVATFFGAPAEGPLLIPADAPCG